MIVTRTPFRLSFVGGSSDIPSFNEHETGAVVTTTIDKYMYVSVNHRPLDPRIRVSYSKTEDVPTTDDLEHDLVRECLREWGVTSNIEITSTADIPGGTGLGSSSAYTAGLIKALHRYCTRGHSSNWAIAAAACQMEIVRCKKPIGFQDQFACALGGIRLLEFHPDSNVTTEDVRKNIAFTTDNKDVAAMRMAAFHARLLLLYTGDTRSANAILARQSAAMLDDRTRASVRSMVSMAYAFRDALVSGSLDDLGPILHSAWMVKRSLTEGITNDRIDRAYRIGREWGATGGKLLGAGGGGFLLFYAEPDMHPAICKALPELTPLPFQFETEGCQVVYP